MSTTVAIITISAGTEEFYARGYQKCVQFLSRSSETPTDLKFVPPVDTHDTNTSGISSFSVLCTDWFLKKKNYNNNNGNGNSQITRVFFISLNWIFQTRCFGCLKWWTRVRGCLDHPIFILYDAFCRFGAYCVEK